MVEPPRTTVMVATEPSFTVYAGALNFTERLASMIVSTALLRVPSVAPLAGLASVRGTVRLPVALLSPMTVMRTSFDITPASNTRVDATGT